MKKVLRKSSSIQRIYFYNLLPFQGVKNSYFQFSLCSIVHLWNTTILRMQKTQKIWLNKTETQERSLTSLDLPKKEWKVLMRTLNIVATHWKAAFFFAKSWQALWPRVALYCDVSLMSGGMSRSTDLEINDILSIFLEITHLSKVKRKSDHSSSPHFT